MARLQVLLGSTFIVVGIGLLALTAGLYGYGEYERIQFERGQAERYRIEDATATTESLRVAYETAVAPGLATAAAAAESARPTAAPGTPLPIVAVAPPTPPATPSPAPSGPRAPPQAPAGAGTASRAPSGPVVLIAAPPPPTAGPVVIRRIFAKAIGLDAEVVESKIENGEWQVPKFVAGHLQGTGLPGGGGNVVLSGHVQSISSGNVFANIDRLSVGDEVTLRTSTGPVVYRIGGKNIVKNDDLSVVQATGTEELTLITCTGTFNILTQDYTQRWVVWGTRV